MLLNALFVKDVMHPFSKSIRLWLAEHRHATLNQMTQRLASALDMQGRPQENNTLSAERVR